MVVLDADESSRERISYAAALAARFEAHLVGLYLTISSLTRDQYALLDIGILDISFFSDHREEPRGYRENTRALRGGDGAPGRLGGMANGFRLSGGNGRYARPLCRPDRDRPAGCL